MIPAEYVVNPYGYKVVLERGEDDFIVASCPELPGCYSQGRTTPEALGNIVDAIIGYLSLLEEEHKEWVPPPFLGDASSPMETEDYEDRTSSDDVLFKVA